MQGKGSFAVSGLIAFFVLLWPLLSAGDDDKPKVRRVTCSPKKAVGNELRKLDPGDTLLISGTCNENVVIPAEIHNVTLDGQGTAMITGPDANQATILIRGSSVTVENFASLSGGNQVIHVQRGGSAVIRNNTIENGTRGVLVNTNAYARIENNRIQNHAGDTASDGITVRLSSSADILANVIAGNARRGVRVTDGAAADVSGNEITNNGLEGILVNRNSFIRISGDTDVTEPANFIEGNTRGVRCLENSSLRVQAVQDFGTGNPPANVAIAGSCTVTGDDPQFPMQP